MISRLRGLVEHISGNVLTLDVHGVGYELFCSGACLARSVVGEELRAVVYTDVKEDSIRLYAFADELEKQVFILLMTVKGVGAKSAADVISRIDKLELLRIVAAGDTNRLQMVKGIGKKTSERIVLELKDKVGEYIMARPESGLKIERTIESPYEDAIEALMTLGFPRKEAEVAVRKVEGAKPSGAVDSAVVIKEALRHL